jgi:cobalt-zinc-cadmium efflux system membrane fusion protein
VSSPELTQAQLNFLRANSAFSLAERAVDRARQLFGADVISAAELQRRETELAVTKAELRAANDHLSMLGFDSEMQMRIRNSGQLESSVAVRASRPGVVLERNVSPGQVAQPGDRLFTVADLSALWAVGALPEQSASFARVGQSVEIEVPALSNRRFRARIVFVGDIVQPETRTVAIRTEVDNSTRELKPQMLAKLLLIGPKEQALAVPDTAVVRESDRDHVFVRTGEDTFRLQPLELGPSVQGRRAVLRGLREGTPIVREGAFHLNNERKRAELE